MGRGVYLGGKEIDSIPFDVKCSFHGFEERNLGRILIRRKIKGVDKNSMIELQKEFIKYQNVIKTQCAKYIKSGKVYKGMVNSAKEALRIAEGRNAEFNNYMGNLDHSYHALIASPRKNSSGTYESTLVQIEDSVAPWGNITKNTFKPIKKDGKTVSRGGRGGRIIKLTVGRHHITRTKYKKTRKGRKVSYTSYKSRDQLEMMYRYAHKKEDRTGYHSRAKKARTLLSKSSKGNGMLVTTMTIFNAAPYALAVNKKHRVLGAGARSGSLIRNITKKSQAAIMEQISSGDLASYVRKNIKKVNIKNVPSNWDERLDFDF